jgi:hypothetical protein
MSSSRHQTRAKKQKQELSKKQNPDVSEEGKQQEPDLLDQPSSSWSNVGGAEEKSGAEPRESLTGDTGNEVEAQQQGGWDFNSSENESSHSSISSSRTGVVHVKGVNS